MPKAMQFHATELQMSREFAMRWQWFDLEVVFLHNSATKG